MTDTNDIADRLRDIDFASCMDSDHLFDGALIDAADEIDRLRAEVAALKAERDEARREICNGVARRNWPSSFHFDRMRRKYAAQRGWNCFDAKEVKP